MIWSLALTAALAGGDVPLQPYFTYDLMGVSGEVTAEPLAWPEGATVRWQEPADGPDVLALATRWTSDLPTSVSVPIGQSFARLDVAWTSVGLQPPRTTVGFLEVVYGDGQSLGQRVSLGDQVSRLGVPGSGPRAEALDVGQGRAVTVYHWTNPRPDVPVESLIFKSARGDQLWCVFGLTLDPPVGAVPQADVLGDGFSFELRPTSPAPPQPDDDPSPRLPAGSHGFVTATDGHFVFEDGERARFWGVNLTNASCVPEKDDAEVLARHLAEMGFNMVRLHHCDSSFTRLVQPARLTDQDPVFDAALLDRFDWFVAQLRQQGIYVFLELATQRKLVEADNVRDPSALVPNGHKLVPMFDDAWRDAYLMWGRKWLGRTNPYTGLRYADDPAIAVVELSNEHSLSVSWGTGALERLPAVHRATLDARWNAWLAERYADGEALAAAWTGSVHPGLQDGETWGRVSREPTTRGLLDAWPAQRRRDLYDFYTALERAFYEDVRVLVRDELGFRVPFTPTISFDKPVLAALVDTFDFADTHFSYDNPGGGQALSNRSLVAEPRSSRGLERMAFAHLDRPACISEVNNAFPNQHQAEAPLLWASVASVQDWDCVVWFDYVNGPYQGEFGGVAGQHELRDAAVKWAQMPAASALFRTGAIAPATGLWVRHLSAEAVREETIHKADVYWPELGDVGFALSHQLRRSFGPDAPVPVPGTPGDQVGWWPDAQRLWIETDTLQAVVGDHRGPEPGVGEGGGPLRVSRLVPELDGFAAVSLWSLDGSDLAQSSRALLTVAGAMHNEGMVMDPAHRLILVWGGGTSWLTRPQGAVRFAWAGRPVVRPVYPDGTRGEPVPVERAGGGWWLLPLDQAGETLWWELSSRGADSARTR